MNEPDEIELAQLIASLPPAPEAWVQAAKELPFALPALDTLVAEAELDAQLRQAVLDDLESAIQRTGHAPTPALVAELRRRLEA
jgi:type VI protein secretion system component VasF